VHAQSTNIGMLIGLWQFSLHSSSYADVTPPVGFAL